MRDQQTHPPPHPGGQGPLFLKLSDLSLCLLLCPPGQLAGLNQKWQVYSAMPGSAPQGHPSPPPITFAPSLYQLMKCMHCGCCSLKLSPGSGIQHLTSQATNSASVQPCLKRALAFACVRSNFLPFPSPHSVHRWDTARLAILRSLSSPLGTLQMRAQMSLPGALTGPCALFLTLTNLGWQAPCRP